MIIKVLSIAVSNYQSDKFHDMMNSDVSIFGDHMIHINKGQKTIIHVDNFLPL